MSYISKGVRKQVYERAHYRCEYCQTAQKVTAWIEIDHILPVALGGESDLANLCASCHACNNQKSDAIEALDPVTNTVQKLFNPRQQKWDDHFQWDKIGITILGITPTGRATVSQLNMNRPEILASRKMWVSVGWHPPK